MAVHPRFLFAFKLMIRHKIKLAIVLVLLIAYYFCLPKPLFHKPYATVVLSEDSQLLGARIAADGQWRFPMGDSIPYKFETCLLTFEDRYFYHHPGFNPMSIWNALVQNIKAKKIVRGGSTLTQQVIRLSRNAQHRSFFEKTIEFVLATRLEFRHSKKEILALYAAHAPFGGNVVGLEMASWRYFGLPAHQLSWAESATLAVLPNAPSLIRPGKNQDILLRKRNALLLKLFSDRIIDEITYNLALEETLPSKPFDLPQIAPHFVSFCDKKNSETTVKSSIQFDLQERINSLAQNYYHQFSQNEIYNLAVLVVDVETRKVLAYVGNAPTDEAHQKDVDIIHAPRSTGSILKPLLYAGMLDDGQLLPETLVPDIPTQIGGFSPQNYHLSYDGAVPAKKALSRSLNIPAVIMLKDYGVPRFYEHLQWYGLTDIKNTPQHYGLSLILGGAESNLWDLTKAYAGLASTLNYFTASQAKYRTQEFAPLRFDGVTQTDFGAESYHRNIVGAGAIYSTFEAMKAVNRPEGDEAWQFYDSAIEIAWKTGTSYGNRDAWAIGLNKKYVVSVWVGNATGEGRPDLTGVSSAAPLLFDVFRLLPKQEWFQKPLNDLEAVDVCEQSGMLPNENCPTKKQWIPLSGKESPVCVYHKLIHLDASGNFRVNSDCESVAFIKSEPWFVLPPVMEWYYKKKNASYAVLPPYREDCKGKSEMEMAFIYPKNQAKLILTKDFNGQVQPIIFKVAHAKPAMQLFWYLGETYLGETQYFHEMPILAPSGKHKITVVDAHGVEIIRWVTFENE